MEPPPEVVEEFNRLYDSVHFDADPRAAIEISKKALAFAQKHSWELGVARGHAIVAVSYASVGEHEIATTHYEIAIPMLERLDFPKSLIVKNNYANLLQSTDLARSLALHRSVSQSASVMPDCHIPLALSLIGLSNDYDRLGDLEKTIDYNLQALKLAKEYNVKEFISTIKINLGEQFAKRGDFELALSYGKEAVAMEVSHGGHRELSLFENILSRIYCKMGLPKEAEEAARKSLNGAKQIDMPEDSETMLALAEALSAQGKMSEALDWFGRANDLSGRYPHVKRNILLSMAKTVKASDIQRSIALLQELLSLAIESADKENEANAHLVLSDCFKALNNPTEALDHFQKYYDLRNQIFSEKSAQQLLALRVEQEMEKHESAAKELRLQKDHLENQLATQATSLAAQTELLSHFRDELRQIVREIEDPINALKKIKERLKTLPCEEIDWIKFEKEFLTVHPEFRKKLHEKYPDLTNQELRLCQLLRTGLKSHEVARLMCITERGVEQHRLRVRRKLGLQGKDSLTEFLKAL